MNKIFLLDCSSGGPCAAAAPWRPTAAAPWRPTAAAPSRHPTAAAPSRRPTAAAPWRQTETDTAGWPHGKRTGKFFFFLHGTA